LAAAARCKFLKQLRKRSFPKRNTEAWQEGRKIREAGKEILGRKTFYFIYLFVPATDRFVLIELEADFHFLFFC